jgi:hypothetical protein
MKIPTELKAAYKLVKNVERSDFLLGDTPHWKRAGLQKTSDDLLAAQYNLYVAACLAKNVQPVLKDFLVGEIPDGVMVILEHVENEVEPDRRERLAASALLLLSTA